MELMVFLNSIVLCFSVFGLGCSLDYHTFRNMKEAAIHVLWWIVITAMLMSGIWVLGTLFIIGLGSIL